MREKLNDIMNYTTPLGILNVIKITGDKKETIVESYDDGLTVILKGKSKKPIKEFAGEFALHQLSILNGYLNFPTFQTDEATLSIETKDVAGVETPVELKFDAGNDGTKAVYRFMDAKFAKQPKLAGKVKWDLEMTLSKSKIAEFERLAKIFGSLKPYFLASVEDGNLYFSLGGSHSSDSNAKVFVCEVDGNIKGEPYFPITQFLNILKLTKDDEVDICFADNGSMKISINSDEFEYDYYLPSRQKEG